MAQASPVIKLNPLDNVAVARVALAAGTVLPEFGITVAEAVPQGHKVALAGIAEGEPVRKYGQIIGFASTGIEPGRHVHTQNLAMRDVEQEHHFGVDAREPDYVPEAQRARFMGYRRASGKVGTRNYIAVISSVNCSATVSKAVADHFNRQGGLEGRRNIDGIVALTHGGGCAINTQTEGYQYLTRTIRGYAMNPNFGGVVMIGLGCETNQISLIKEMYGLQETPTFRTMNIQGVGGTRKTIDAASAVIREMLDEVDGAQRTSEPVSELTLALECGGSDGYSGISANPALGYASDLLVRHGGTAILSETPEIYGAEHLLTSRAASPEVARKLLERIEWWRDYAERNRAELNNNPSYGNKAGGLTTILEKSLGAVAKGGNSRLNAVYEYAEPVREKGFVFMDTPGYDPVAVTGQVAGGANMICFTTGRGSTSGFKPAPCIKLATNNAMYEHMSDDMDVNCGGIVTGGETIEESGRKIFDKIVSVASGERTLSEQYDYGNNEFVPWQVGAVM
ncbi:altronate dehydratase family protein [Azospirillum sp. SYSU D00513]|uniref:UxaA family hydrolase n=1 Tax=Azospirillum sp. SYSU D00513 TaxID=2812561 RepID=UPI001A972266|nr:altronate dehydratase family protein [Azospirillum sp. SYSU D00513]